MVNNSGEEKKYYSMRRQEILFTAGKASGKAQSKMGQLVIYDNFVVKNRKYCTKSRKI